MARARLEVEGERGIGLRLVRTIEGEPGDGPECQGPRPDAGIPIDPADRRVPEKSIKVGLGPVGPAQPERKQRPAPPRHDVGRVFVHQCVEFVEGAIRRPGVEVELRPVQAPPGSTRLGPSRR